nr:MAG TPA: hypothetical protein [Caudoviricetes sp.]
MKRGTKEFYEVMEQFEKDIPKFAYIPAKFERAAKGVTTHFYEDGKTNELFKAYMLGYEAAKCVYAD